MEQVSKARARPDLADVAPRPYDGTGAHKALHGRHRRILGLQ